MRILLLLSILGGALSSVYFFHIDGVNRYEIIIATAQITITIILGIVTYFQADTQNKLDMLDKTPYLRLNNISAGEKEEKGKVLHFQTDNSIGIVNAKVCKVDISKRWVRIIENNHLSKFEKALNRFLLKCEKFEYSKLGDELIILNAFYNLKNKYKNGINDFWDWAERILLNQVYRVSFSELNIKPPLYCSSEDVKKIIADDNKGVEKQETKAEEIRKRKEQYEKVIHWYSKRIKIVYRDVTIKNMKNESSTDTSIDIAISKNNEIDLVFAIKYYSVFLYPYTQIVKIKSEEKYRTAVFIGFRKVLFRKEFDKYFE